jgi:hypothetical protein
MAGDTIYHGRREDGTATVTVQHGSIESPLSMRHDLHNHSPDGPEWGYGGSGPAQLALALLAHATGDDRRALASYQRYKWSVVGGLPHSGWSLTREAVLLVLEQLEAEEMVELSRDPQARVPAGKRVAGAPLSPHKPDEDNCGEGR